MQRPSSWTPERALLLTVLLTTAIYWRDLSYDFILDDVPLVLMNPLLTTWRNLAVIFRTDIFQTPNIHTAALHYRPVYISWLLLNHALFGMVLPWWHLTSLLLHLAVTLLVYRLGLKLLNGKWLAALAAALFAIHPVHAEPVAYLTASTDLLVAFFSLVALLFYIRFREEGKRPGDLIVSVVSAAAAMLSKESAGMFPWLLVAYEALKAKSADEPGGWKRYAWTLPYFAVGAAYFVVRTALFGLNAGPGPGGSRFGALIDVPLVALVYIKNVFFPLRLSFFYPPAWSVDWTVAKALGVALLCMAVVLIWKRHKDRPAVRILLAWTAILFVPAALALSAFIRDEWVHDRHAYFATVPVCLLIIALLAEWIRSPRRLAAVFAVVILLLALDTWYQVPRFENEISVYASALKIAPRNAAMHRYYASALWKYGRQDQAMQEFRTVIELEPDSPTAHAEYAGALAEIGRNATALQEYEKALAYLPAPSGQRAQVLYRLAELEVAPAELDRAAAHLREAIAIAPKALNYHSALADVLRKQGDAKAADEELRLESLNREQFLERRKAQRQ